MPTSSIPSTVLQGCNMSDATTSPAPEAAQRMIEGTDVIRLSLADQQCFAGALIAPPELNLALRRAFLRRDKLLHSE
jgi:uncharacterized protein (DUF1778 family)